jgi:hypothetical protein
MDWFGVARDLLVQVDGVNVGRVKVNSSVELSVSQGEHRISISMDWCKSIPVTVTAMEGEDVTLEVITPDLMSSAIGCIFEPSKVFDLRRI